jgi:signal peptide peptidase SppA
MYHRIRKFKDAHPRIPVVVSMGDLAASGGYYLSCGADYIFAQETTLTADIGVLMPSCNFAAMGDKWGVQDATVCAPKGGYKNAGWPLKPVNSRDSEYFQGLVDDMFERFKGVVGAGRKLTKTQVDAVADGRAYIGPAAQKLGLVDQLGYLDDALAYATTSAGLSSNRSVVRLHEPTPGLLQQLLLGGNGEDQSRWPGSSPNASTTVNGINVNFDGASLNSAATPRLLYLFQGQ